MLRSPPSERAGDEEGAGFDAVGDDAVLCAFQLAHALNADGRGAGARNASLPSCSAEGGEVGDLRLTSAVLEDSFALGERRGHQQVFGAGDGDSCRRQFQRL
jgi:hypothetical protein